MAGGIANLVKSLTDVSVEHGNIPTYGANRKNISYCSVMTAEEHGDDNLPDKYVYVC